MSAWRSEPTDLADLARFLPWKIFRVLEPWFRVGVGSEARRMGSLIHGVLEVMPAADYSACLKEARSC